MKHYDNREVSEQEYEVEHAKKQLKAILVTVIILAAIVLASVIINSI